MILPSDLTDLLMIILYEHLSDEDTIGSPGHVQYIEKHTHALTERMFYCKLIANVVK